jgi:hypothetical protein
MISLLKRGHREMKTIEESIQKDFDIYAKKQRPYLQKKQKIRQFSNLDVDEKIGYSIAGFFLGWLFLVAFKLTFVNMHVDYFTWLACSLSFLGFSSFFVPRLIIRLEKILFPMKGKRLEHELINSFDSEKISDSVHNTLKIRLSMDEYKYLFINYGNSPTYGNLKSFLSKCEKINDQLKAAEQSKLNITLTTQEIARYQKINLTK